MITLAASDTEIERVLKGSVLLQAEVNAHRKTASKLDTAVKQLKTFLDEFEGNFDYTNNCDSAEIALHYISSAKWVRDNFGRKGDRIRQVQEWVDEYLA